MSRFQHRPQTPLRCICRAVERDSKNPTFVRRSMSMLSLGDRDLGREDYHDSFSSYSESSSYSDSSEHGGDSHHLYECIDDLVDQLVATATKNYLVSDPVQRINQKAVWSPEQQTIDLAVKRIDVPHRSASDAGKSYYELRILAGSGGGGYGYGSEAAMITSVLIGYACLEGVDHGMHLRRYTFQDSQHLYEFCQQLDQKGRFEDAAF